MSTSSVLPPAAASAPLMDAFPALGALESPEDLVRCSRRSAKVVATGLPGVLGGVVNSASAADLETMERAFQSWSSF
jgi:hypothetical protein